MELNFWALPIGQYRFLIFTNAGNVSKTKYNLTLIRKLVKRCFMRYSYFWHFITRATLC